MSSAQASTTCNRRRVRSRCFRNRMPRPAPVGRAFDQPGNVGDHEAAIRADADDAELRVQRGERIVGDLRSRGREGPRQRRLAGVRRPEQAHVGEQLERELEAPRLARLAGVELARRPIHAGLEARVAAASLTALRDQQRVAVAQSGRRASRQCRGRAPLCPSAPRSRDPRPRPRSCPCRTRRDRSRRGSAASRESPRAY